MAYSPITAIDLGLVAGRFDERECGHCFEFSTPCETPFEGYDRKIWVGPMAEETRFVRVLKTVAYVVVDEAADGAPVVEKWDIKNFKHYAGRA
jgi:hypothetical protein